MAIEKIVLEKTSLSNPTYIVNCLDGNMAVDKHAFYSMEFTEHYVLFHGYKDRNRPKNDVIGVVHDTESDHQNLYDLAKKTAKKMSDFHQVPLEEIE